MNFPLRIILTILSVCLSYYSRGQQSIQFTQYVFNSVSVNPAYAGYKEEWFGQMGLRSQWTGWDGAPKTGTLSVDGVVDPVSKRHGVALQLTTDKLGAQRATSVYGSYALRLQLDRSGNEGLAVGVGGGVTQYGLDGHLLDPVDRNDQAIPDGMITSWHPDLRLGLYYYNPRWYAGLSFQDILSDQGDSDELRYNANSLESLYRTVNSYFIAGALFSLEEGLLLRPSLLIKDDFSGPTVLDINALFIFQDKFWIGGGYRTRARIINRDYYDQSAIKLSSLNALTGIAQFQVNRNLRIGYSYDIMLNSMKGLQSGTHEVTLGVTFGRILEQLLSPRYF
ncbi:PorP/SprF family type IX secretion system membrane protein [Sphingobacterium sp. LRF_L2]|uniref:PorP/SprF family type IX secretion system membrane protein n=1 Tax=Sphingobacterium sp. LRF_L2 TaxID=3369421 RepID=UPI003F61070D